MSRTRNRPPKLEPRVAPPRTPAPPPTPAELLVRAKVAGAHAGRDPGRTELRHLVDRCAAGDRAALGELAPMPDLTALELWDAIALVYGADPDAPAIDPKRTIDAFGRALTRLASVADAGARIALATANPAALLPLFMRLGSVASGRGAEVADLPDAGPMRVDGRTGRSLRWFGGVAAVVEHGSVLATRDGEAAREWFFVLPRPALVVADGSFAEVAWEAGVEVVAFAGLDRPGLAVAAARDDRCTVVPLRTDRAPRGYRALETMIDAAAVPPSVEM